MDQQEENARALELLRRWLNAYTLTEREQLDGETRRFLVSRKVDADQRGRLDSWLSVLRRVR